MTLASWMSTRRLSQVWSEAKTYWRSTQLISSLALFVTCVSKFDTNRGELEQEHAAPSFRVGVELS